jgi:Ca2+-binding RTX toxin-like protein
LSHRSRRRGCALATILAAFALLAAAPGAFAASLNVDLSGNLVFAASAGETNYVAFDEVDSDTVEVTQAVSSGDSSTITPDGTNCVADTVGAPGDDNTFTCDNVTGGVIATALDLNDNLDASGGYTGNGGLIDKPANFDGGDGNDELDGGLANDLLHGGNGDDSVYGDFAGSLGSSANGGDDQVFGDAGYDYVAGGSGNDTVDGGADADNEVVGGPGNDTVTGGDGDDGYVVGGPGDDNVSGGNGNDDVYGDCDGGCGASRADGNDIVNGDAGDDSVNGEGGNDIVHGGDGNDDVEGDYSNSQNGNDQLFGDAGNDGLYAKGGNDALDGGDGNDDLRGGKGDDALSGGNGDDNEQGASGNDTVNGDAGDDYVTGDCGGYSDCGDGVDGNDIVNGGSGEDYADADGGADVIDMGSGVSDEISYPDRIEVCNPGCDQASWPVSVSQDGAANDGGPGEGDNVTNTEDVYVYDGCCGTPPAPGNATLTGDAGTNALGGGSGNDVIDGGAGNDFLYGNGGDDTLNANDGFSDRVVCGAGNDTANVDEFDIVSDDCETVNRTTRGNLATEDAPPSVAWTSPASKAKLSTKTANTLTVTASDDKGVTQVVFLANERVICVAKTAPYTCSYKPTDADVGRTALTAVAFDTSQQTASAIRVVTIPRFTARSVSIKATPRKDTTAPFRFRTSGRVSLPAGVTKANGCKGSVLVTFKAGAKTISARHAKLSKSCTYHSTVTFRIPSRLHPKSLKAHVSFRGNAVLSPKGSKNIKVKVA